MAAFKTAQDEPVALELLAQTGIPVLPHRDAGNATHRLLIVGGRLMAACRLADGRAVSACDPLHDIHPDNRRLAERAARVAGMANCGVDLAVRDVARSWQEAGGAVCGLRFQVEPDIRAAVHCGLGWEEEFLGRMFERTDAHIPIAAVTGAGAGTVSLLVQRVLSLNGKTAGASGPRGLRIGRDVVRRDCASAFEGGRMLLADVSPGAATGSPST
jgi:cyanophycin synthetase